MCNAKVADVHLRTHKTQRWIIDINVISVMKFFQAIMLYQHTNLMYTEPTNPVEILPIAFTKLGATSAMFLLL